jgi:hypothetical protein
VDLKHRAAGVPTTPAAGFSHSAMTISPNQSEDFSKILIDFASSEGKIVVSHQWMAGQSV